ncbi:Methylated-DNA--protein-cysteine methyltransferase, constitutive [Rosistilla carotiformis]|uniref:methylated-DNA--[protein]-cysteine S-methyltransferase n=1 Tax=Rosistilla carotiformis TaxID=2528017 RepID=A0A518JQX3_9BACT|nr:methylated-DNA--[protein]-cysteine S-methyltransferase [Rosistilla carotiformis]QDV67942.1 Methylated-DNA--protein-cysteine methyltransferase, constitutive [Rosistilla carotiformis]
MLPIECTGLCETPLGILTHQWTTAGLFRIRLFADPSSAGIQEALQQTEAKQVRHRASFAQRIDAYFKGQPTTFDDIPVDASDWSPFFAQVYHACRKVPAGQIISYKELACRAGRPAASRAVGQAMARNRIPIVIPCHRIVGSNGRLTGFSADGGIETKRWLLDRERGDTLFPNSVTRGG